uniref:Uncharacterized protein n=1 Tax=Periophthalmus magnuspinnatus TaxID=409849 RepID=A0A3B4B1E6_9GOBI
SDLQTEPQTEQCLQLTSHPQEILMPSTAKCHLQVLLQNVDLSSSRKKEYTHQNTTYTVVLLCEFVDTESNHAIGQLGLNNRISGILTSQTEPFDLSFSRSFQSLSHLPPSYEAAMAADLSRFSSLKKLSDKDVDEYYTRKRHLPDLAARGTLPLHVLKMSQELRQRPRRVQRAMSQDRVLTPQTRLSQEHLYPKDRHYSQERLYSQDRLYSQEHKLMIDKSISRAISHTDVFMPTTPIMDRYKMAKMHSHPSASNNGSTGHSNTLAMNQTASKRQAFASRRTHTVEQLHYVPQQQHHQQQQAQSQHYRTGSKTEVTV